MSRFSTATLRALPVFLFRVLRESVGLYWDLVKIMVPVMVAVKVAVMLGLIGVLSAVFEPLMTLVGLPQEMGLVWATAALVNIYGGAAALIGVLPEAPLTVAQITVLLSMILAFHSIPVEQRVCQKAGTSIIFTTALRFGAAMLYGAVLNGIYLWLDVLQQPVEIAWLPSTSPDAGWMEWLENSAISLAGVFVIIVGLMLILRIFDVLGVTELCARALQPALRFMGMSKDATPIAIVGVLLGLSYGGGLIIREAKAGHMSPRDILLSVSLLAICHSMIEDTLFMLALGGDWTGIVAGRIVFSVIAMAILAKIIHALPDRHLAKLVHVPDKKPDAPVPAAAE